MKGLGRGHQSEGQRRGSRGSPCRLPPSLAPPRGEGVPVVSPACPPLFCSGPKGKVVPRLGPLPDPLKWSPCPGLQEGGRKSSESLTPEPGGGGPPCLACSIFSHPF